MSNIFYNDKPKHLIELASLDESASYEVDMTEIYYDLVEKDFVLLTASGCSCWNGEYDEEHFKTLKKLKEKMFETDRTYNPTIMGAISLVAKAKENWKIYKTKKEIKDTSC